MSGFKLIAIVPLMDCDKKYCKSLERGKPYQFYSPYTITLNNDKSEIDSVKRSESSIPKDFYTSENGINLNFSAVVGKNGSGKSTLFELLYYLIYVIGTEKKFEGRELLSHPSSDLENKSEMMKQDRRLLDEKIREFEDKGACDFPEGQFVNGISFFCFSLIKKYNLRIDNNTSGNELEFYKKVSSDIGHQVSVNMDVQLRDEKKQEQNIREGLRVSVIYEIDNSICEVTYSQSNFSFYQHDDLQKQKRKSLDEFDLENFFYNVSINYSHHGLNSRTLGNWVTKLFHKNDAYTTPVVINPMRTDGDFNINDELELSKERLMSNLVYGLVQSKESLLLGKYRVSKFIFSPKKLNIYPLSYDKKLLTGLKSGDLIKKKLGIEKINDNIGYWDFAIGYLEDKINRIEENYPFLLYDQDFPDTKGALSGRFLQSDKSHVTKKVRQVINFLTTSYKQENRQFWQPQSDNVRAIKDRSQILDWLNRSEQDIYSLKPSDLIEYALPGFFSIDFELEDKDGNAIKFGNLSSGEQQMILNINAIQYHLYNLQSVHVSGPNINLHHPGNKGRAKYENINIILDEVELYYHPDMQRSLVKNLMDAFENVKDKGDAGISSINVCFLTHSPFILSDIPSENVLRLNRDNNENELKIEETIAANIHDLLASSFFLDTLMGEFADHKITQVIDNISKREFEDEEQKIIDIIGDSFLKTSVQQYKKTLDD